MSRPRVRGFAQATCLVCRREVWSWDDGSSVGPTLWDVEYYDGRMHLISHPCWADDADDLMYHPIPGGDLS